jgi:hypothetical protein
VEVDPPQVEHGHYAAVCGNRRPLGGEPQTSNPNRLVRGVSVPRRAVATTVLEVVGIALIVAGCALFSAIVGLIVAGFGLILIGWRLA